MPDAAPRVAAMVAVLALIIGPAPAWGDDGRVSTVSAAPFAQVAQALEQAIGEAGMALVYHADAQRGAAARGVRIRGNQVLMVFRNDFAVRLLAADPAAGFEAPLRIYLYENADGTATVSYVPPTGPALTSAGADPGLIRSPTGGGHGALLGRPGIPDGLE